MAKGENKCINHLAPKMKKGLTSLKTVDSSTTAMGRVNHMGSCKRARRKCPGSYNGQSRSFVSMPPKQIANHAIQGKKRKCLDSRIEPVSCLESPSKRKKYTTLQMSKRSKKRQHQARVVRDANDSDEEREAVSKQFTNKENELNELFFNYICVGNSFSVNNRPQSSYQEKLEWHLLARSSRSWLLSRILMSWI